eukprot:6183681-Pleurochrysis_carterae.AAC.1
MGGSESLDARLARGTDFERLLWFKSKYCTVRVHWERLYSQSMLFTFAMLASGCPARSAKLAMLLGNLRKSRSDASYVHFRSRFVHSACVALFAVKHRSEHKVPRVIQRKAAFFLLGAARICELARRVATDTNAVDRPADARLSFSASDALTIQNEHL